MPFGTDLLFHADGEPDVIVGVEICEDLWVPIPPSSFQALAGANLLLNLSASNEVIGKAAYRRQLVAGQSGRCIAGYVYASCGVRESTTDLVFGGHCLIAENGTLLAESERFRRDEQLLVADVDLDRLRGDRLRTTTFARKPYPGPRVDFRPHRVHARSRRRPSRRCCATSTRIRSCRSRPRRCASAATKSSTPRSPAWPSGWSTSASRRSTSASPAASIRRWPCSSPARRWTRSSVPRSKILALTMPGFGTTGRTLANARALMKHLGVTAREVDIRPLCLEEWKALGHSPFGIACDGLDVDGLTAKLRQVPAEKRCDLVFENVQARMRTELLMNTGFVIGTGDVSELALGWCTYNADHMSMYNPNVSIPKTLVKFLVGWAAEHEFSGEARKTLLDIVATEISPELLPTDAAGAATQATEGDDRPLRTARLLPVPLPALRRAAGEDPLPGEAREVPPGLFAGRSEALAGGVPEALLRQPVQAERAAGRAEGRLDQPVAARRLADAVGRGRRRRWLGRSLEPLAAVIHFGGRSPQPRDLVAAAAGDVLAVRGDGKRQHGLAVAGELVHLVVRVHVPHADRAVRTWRAPAGRPAGRPPPSTGSVDWIDADVIDAVRVPADQVLVAAEEHPPTDRATGSSR